MKTNKDSSKKPEPVSDADCSCIKTGQGKRQGFLPTFWKIGMLVAAGVISAWIAPCDFTQAQRIMVAIFVVAAGLWVTEVVPAFATAILVIVSCVYLLGLPGGALGFHGDKDYLIFIKPVADPVIVLFFGGFSLAIAITKYGLDRIFASLLLRPFVGSPNLLLLGVIFVTGFFSMFMSNTATTLMMMAILMPMLRDMSGTDPARTKLALAVAFAANIGGMGTIIGTPPNAIAVSALSNVGIKVTFLSWMMVGIPLAVILLLALWGILSFLYPSRGVTAPINLEKTPAAPTMKAWLVAGTFMITVLLWMSEALHGLSPAVVALLPLAVFTVGGLLDASDLKRVEWDVLFLVAGGLALGVGLQTTGLSGKIVSLVQFGGLSTAVIFLIIALITVFLSNFMSNTSAANILIPVAVSVGTISPVVGALTVAFCASLAMSLPISTPPNAIVYGTGLVKASDMLFVGSLVTTAGLIIFVITIYLGLERLVTGF